MNCRCGAMVGEDDYRCPKCGRFLRIRSAGSAKTPGPVSERGVTIIDSDTPGAMNWRSFFIGIAVIAALFIGILYLGERSADMPQSSSSLPAPAEGAYRSPSSQTDQASSPHDDPGYRLAAIQLGYRPPESDPLVSEMRQALATLCDHVRADTPENVAAYVCSGQKDLADNGINESILDLCHHLTEASPIAVRPDIHSVVAAYCVLREPH